MSAEEIVTEAACEEGWIREGRYLVLGSGDVEGETKPNTKYQEPVF
jgi:hypothetical protein